MAKRFVWIAVLLMFWACVPCALAMGEVVEVTRESQAKLGLNYTLVAERVDKEAVLVSLEIPRKGKLQNLRSVSMRIGPGRPVVAAPLQTTTGRDGAWKVGFQVSPELAEQCSVDLIVPESGRSYVIYGVKLKGYITDRK